ncbi:MULTISPECIES: MFS transporter [unclassified Arthrobacter]|uniref:MFS transporter n=1 Tax=unclassified Arthrobacter TaxID=235627 RepID=UPI001D148FB2|nr:MULTISPECIES: MFS transporter [unclassified Arthrobacter]MCC3276687.1 MFS transporter [Arthrobacter sp. zg-Y20]MCC9178468.1 MFS transporter [Arthrobacter sp. zg-Y750]MDK1316846.1 MFS transporter [Arthrobacter sp. zg.Y20]WIB06742.1 MFS transporter [Arthrobacter sp. zg-Y20]
MDSPWSPLRRRMFLILWLAQLGSNIGTWMQTVGAQWFLVENSRNPALVSLVQTANLAPSLLLGLVAGVLADAFNRRRLILGANVFAAGAAATLTVVAALGLLNPDSLLLYTFLIGCGIALSTPAWQAITPELVPRKEIQTASALGSVAINTARAVGPAIAGLLVSLVGPAFVFGLNAVSFIGTAAAIYLWRAPDQGAADREHMGEALAAGMRYIRAAPRIRRILLRLGLFVFPASALYALLPVAVNGHLGLGSTGYGLLLGALGAGAILGVLLLPRARKVVGENALLGISSVVFAAGAFAAGYWPAWAVAILLVASGMAWIFTFSTLNAAMQLTLPEWVRARGLSIYLMISAGSQAVGAVFWGSGATGAGYAPTLAFAAVVLALVGASVLVLPLLPGTGKLDRSVAAAPNPDLNIPAPVEPPPDAGPVTVLIAYEVPADRADAFVQAMHEVRLSRMRTGATHWELVHSITDRDQFREIYDVPSWREYLRQEQTRTTGEDRQLIQRAWDLTEEEPWVRWFLPAPG